MPLAAPEREIEPVEHDEPAEGHVQVAGLQHDVGEFGRSSSAAQALHERFQRRQNALAEERHHDDQQQADPEVPVDRAQFGEPVAQEQEHEGADEARRRAVAVPPMIRITSTSAER